MQDWGDTTLTLEIVVTEKEKKASEDRFDYNENGLDDVVVGNVELFRMEWMDDKNVWLRCYCPGKKDVVFWLGIKNGKIVGKHELE